jgi:hypothetical protein
VGFHDGRMRYIAATKNCLEKVSFPSLLAFSLKLVCLGLLLVMVTITSIKTRDVRFPVCNESLAVEWEMLMIV